MNLKTLMSGIGVVIDDEFGKSGRGEEDMIFRIVGNMESEWEMPFYKAHEIPSDGFSDGLLRSASFVLLDWKLWPDSPLLEKEGIKKNIKFLEKAKACFIPVFIFTNEDPSDVAEHLPKDLYDVERPESNFIFIKRKSELAKKEEYFRFNTTVDKNKRFRLRFESLGRGVLRVEKSAFQLYVHEKS